MRFMSSYLALWFLAGFLTLVAIGLLRQVTVLKHSLEGFQRESPLVIGSRAPKFSVVDMRSGRKITGEFLHGRITLILFISPHCSICEHLVYSIDSLFGRYSFSLVAVCKGNEKECRRFTEPLSSEAVVLLDGDGEISEMYGVSNYPVAVVADAERRVLSYSYPTDSKTLEEIVAVALRVGLNSTSQVVTDGA